MDRAERRRRTSLIVTRRKEVMRWSEMFDWATGPRWIGRCKKLHPFNCGRARCGICKPHKRWKKNHTKAERAFWLFEFDCVALN